MKQYDQATVNLALSIIKKHHRCSPSRAKFLGKMHGSHNGYPKGAIGIQHSTIDYACNLNILNEVLL